MVAYSGYAVFRISKGFHQGFYGNMPFNAWKHSAVNDTSGHHPFHKHLADNKDGDNFKFS